MRWVFMPFRRVFDYSGRSSRKEFFSFFLVFWVAIPMTFAVLYPAMRGNGAAAETSDWLLISVLLIMFVLLIPTISLMARRLHDFDWSAWWLLLLLAPIAGVVAAVAILLWVEGNRGANRFGPEPLA